MPRAEDEAVEIARRDDGSLDFDLFRAEYERRLAERQERLSRDARAAARAMDGWHGVRTEDDWLETVRKADEDIESGRFLIDRLGAQRYVDPALTATLLIIRRRLIDEHGANSAADVMLIDSVVLSYYHQLRVNTWLGDLAFLVEQEFFGKGGLSAEFRDRHGRAGHQIRGLQVEELVRRIGEQLLPLMDRANRMMLRNIKALSAKPETAALSVNIGAAGQVNVAAGESAGAGGGARRSGGPDVAN